MAPMVVPHITTPRTLKPSTSPILLALVVITAALLWLPPLDSSLWLDEIDTAFTVKDGVLTAISRNLRAHPQCSTLYNAILAAWVGLFGTSEVVLRLPSVLATVVGLVFLFRIGARLVDRETGMLACLLCVGLRDVAAEVRQRLTAALDSLNEETN